MKSRRVLHRDMKTPQPPRLTFSLGTIFQRCINMTSQLLCSQAFRLDLHLSACRPLRGKSSKTMNHWLDATSPHHLGEQQARTYENSPIRQQGVRVMAKRQTISLLNSVRCTTRGLYSARSSVAVMHEYAVPEPLGSKTCSSISKQAGL